MRLKFILFAAAALVFASPSGRAQETNAPSPAQAQLRALVQEIQAKANAGQRSESNYVAELKSFDALISSQEVTNREDLAQIEFMKGVLYVEVLGNLDKSAETFQHVIASYPEAKFGRVAQDVLSQVEQMKARLEMFKMQEAAIKEQIGRFPDGSTPADFSEKDLNGKPISLASFKGKVLLIDFWATWCPTCVMDLPNVLAAYQKHHAAGFEVLGITLDEDRGQLEKFIKKHDGMDWPQFFDGHRNNKLAAQYGVHLIPFTVLLDRSGKVIATELHGEEIEPAISAALAAK
jgi:peroxiredoxin